MASPIPIASFSNNQAVAEDIRTKLLPEYDVVHICLDLSAAESELPLICSGALETDPASGLGTNATLAAADRKVPRAVIFGGGVPDDQITQITAALKAKAPEVKAVHVSRDDILATGATGPDPELIGRLLREKLAEI